jgi:LPXTG-motif cell wall-anchored protein
MRRVKGLLGVIAGLTLVLHVGGTTAYADDKGNNGTIKIHEAGTADTSNANEPHVCNFHINGNGFDMSASGTWKIELDPNGSTVVASGTWAANTSGDWRTTDMTLPDAHYRASAKQTSPATVGGDKQKVFWVECAQNGNTGSSGSSGNVGSSDSTGTNAGSGVTGSTGTTGTNAETAATGTNAETAATGTNGETGATGETAATGETGAADTNGAMGGEVASSGFGNVPPSGSMSSMGAAPGVSSLPSTSTESNAPLGALGMLILGLAAFILRRPIGQLR